MDYLSDVTRPTATFTAAAGIQPEVATVTVQFSEPVLDFDDTDLDITGMPGLVVSNITATDNKTYIVTLSGATNDGTFTVTFSSTTDVTDLVFNNLASFDSVTRDMGK